MPDQPHDDLARLHRALASENAALESADRSWHKAISVAFHTF